MEYRVLIYTHNHVMDHIFTEQEFADYNKMLKRKFGTYSDSNNEFYIKYKNITSHKVVEIYE